MGGISEELESAGEYRLSLDIDSLTDLLPATKVGIISDSGLDQVQPQQCY